MDDDNIGCLGGQKALDDAGDGGRSKEKRGLLSRGTLKAAVSDEASSDSSSIGVPDDSDAEEIGSGDKDELQSTLSLDSLEHSLPSKGLSSFYAGKSKSFGNLSDVKSVSDIPKADNAFNKRRRNIIAYKFSYSSSSSFSSASKRMMIKDNKVPFHGHEHQDNNKDEDEDD